MADFFVVECRVENCEAEMFVNDICLGRRGGSTGNFLSGPFNEMLVDGENALGLKVLRATQSGARVTLRIARYPFGATSSGPDGVELLRVEWQTPLDDRGDPLPVEFPIEVPSRADLGPLFGTWTWQNAEQIVLADADMLAIVKLLQEIRDGLAAGDAGPFLQATALRDAETARAYDTDFGPNLAEFHRDLAIAARQPWYAMEPIDPESFSPRLCANGRMVWCLSSDGEAMLRQCPDPEGNRIYYDMMLSKIDDKWRVVR